MADQDRCCCNLCHVKTGTWIILVVQFVTTVVGIIQGVMAFIAGEHQRMSTVPASSPLPPATTLALQEGKWAFIIQLISLILWLLLIIMAMFALVKNRARLLFPHLLASVIMFIIFVVEICLILIGGAALANIAFMIFMCLFLLLCLWIEYRCWRYLSTFTV